jgi:hypothetical protein
MTDELKASIADKIVKLAQYRDETIAKRSTAEIIEWIAATADLWRATDSKWLARAAMEGAVATGFSAEMIRLGLRDFFEGVTRSTLTAWVYGELEGMGEWGNGRMGAPRVVTHIFSGNLPNAALQSLLSGLLVKAANVCKCASGDPLLPRLFVESLMEMDAELGRCVLFLDWKGGNAAVESEVFAVSDAIIINGGDEAVESVRRRAPAGMRFLGFGHRVSCAAIARERLTGEELPALAEAAAYDVSIWDQQGCLSPHCIYVEEGGGVSADQFAEALAVEMERFEEKYPRGEISLGEAAAFSRIRGAYEFRASADTGVRVFGDASGNRWAVILEREPMWATSCLNRLVFVKPIARLVELPKYLQAVEEKLSCVGLEAEDSRRKMLTEIVGALGASRVCALGQMQRPPLNWLRDGKRTLRELMGR